MQKSITIKLIACYLLLVTCFAFSKTITGEATYQWSYSESYLDAQKRCKTEAIKNGVESFATYIETETEVKNFMTTKDVIVAKSLALVRNVKIVDEKTDWGNRKIWYKITGEINENEALKALKDKDGDIKTSGLYYFGEGQHYNKRKADKKAIENLVTNIADDLQNQFADILPADEDLYEFTESIINTYATSFNNCQKKIEGKNIIRYIKKSDLLKLFKPRLLKVENYLEMAKKAESETRIGDALKYYYWALSLLRSHPEHNKITSKQFDNKLLLLAIPDKINRIFGSLSAEVTDVQQRNEQKNVYLTLLYNNVDINNIGFSYFRKGDYSKLIMAKNGQALCEFDGLEAKNLNKIKLNIEYRFESAAKIDQELLKVIEEVSNVYFPSSVIYAYPDKKYEQPVKSKIPLVSIHNFKQKNSGGGSQSSAEVTITEKDKDKCASIVAEVFEALDKGRYDSVKDKFTKNGYVEYQKLLGYGQAKLLTSKIELKVGKLNDKIIVRSLPFQFKFKSNDHTTTEKVVFTFDSKSLKIDKLSFALSDLAIKDILTKPDSFATIEEKLQLIQFMEYYKTAYCLKEYDYIKQIFAENALIIIGKVLKQNPKKQLGEIYDRLGKDKVKYIRMKKSEYLEHLDLVFKSKEFINLAFEDNQLRKLSRDSKVFGIQIKQNYYSSNYTDEGYLFLMMDLNNPELPEIHVRSWQPEKNDDGSIIGLKDFTY